MQPLSTMLMSRPADADPREPRRVESAMVKGFGCRPVVTIRVRSEGRRPKASQEEPAGCRVGVRRLWGFDGAAAWFGDAFAGVVGGSDDRGSEVVAVAAVGWAILA